MNLFTVIVPCYNVEKYLPRFFESLINVADLEKINVIFVDDASTDKTNLLLTNFIKNKNNMSLISHKKNLGVGGALNTAISKLQTNWLFRLDPDDIVHSNYIIEIAKTINDNIGLIRFKYLFMENGVLRKPSFIESLYFKISFGWSMGINTKIFGIPIYKENTWTEEIHMYGSQYKRGIPSAFINKYLVTWTKNPTSIMHTIHKSNHRLDQWEEGLQIYKNNKDIRGWRVCLYKIYTKHKINKFKKRLAQNL